MAHGSSKTGIHLKQNIAAFAALSQPVIANMTTYQWRGYADDIAV
jgi:hypothetical protein